jgi:hypothetical protein
MPGCGSATLDWANASVAADRVHTAAMPDPKGLWTTPAVVIRFACMAFPLVAGSVACAQSHTGHARARLRLARDGASGGRPVGREQFGTHTSMRLRQVSRISMKGNYQSACKPGSVWSCLRDGHSSGTTLARRLVQPTRVAGQETGSAPRVATHARPPLFGLAPGGVYPATPVSRRAVRSYRTLSPLPRRPKPTWWFAFCGTFPGVAPGGR